MADNNLPSTALAKQAAAREISTLVQAGFLTEVQQRQLSTAVGSARVMSTVATPNANRLMPKITTLLDVRLDTPISRAREVLAGIGEQWTELRADFHRYRKMGAELKVLRTKAEALMGSQDPVQVAEAELMLVEADELEANLEAGVAKFQAAVDRLGQMSERYERICISAGKQEFTEADFREEEIRHTVLTLVWHAAQTGSHVDIRDKHTRREREEAFTRMSQSSARRADFQAREEQIKYAKVVVPSDARRCLAELGVLPQDIERDVGELLAMRHAHGLLGPRVDSFEPKFESWLQRTAEKYLPAARSAISAHGTERLHRIMKLLNPDQADRGTERSGARVERGGVVEDDY